MDLKNRIKKRAEELGFCYIQDLKLVLNNPDEMIRSHVLWALNKLEKQAKDRATTVA